MSKILRSMSHRYRRVCKEILIHIDEEVVSDSNFWINSACVAGGSLVGEIYNKPYNDVDVFISVREYELKNNKFAVDHFFDKLCSTLHDGDNKVENISVIKGVYGDMFGVIKRITNFQYKGFNVQIILCNKQNPHYKFDLSMCRLAMKLNYHKNLTLQLTPDFQRNYEKKTIKLYNTTANIDKSLRRMNKYLQRFPDFKIEFDEDLFERDGFEDKINDFISSVELERIILKGG